MAHNRQTKKKDKDNVHVGYTTKYRVQQQRLVKYSFGGSTHLSNDIKFVNKPLSNFDLMDWVKKLGIKHFRGIYSRDNLPKQIMNKEVGIINLDSKIGSGTHWVAYRNIDKQYTE